MRWAHFLYCVCATVLNLQSVGASGGAWRRPVSPQRLASGWPYWHGHSGPTPPIVFQTGCPITEALSLLDLIIIFSTTPWKEAVWRKSSVMDGTVSPPKRYVEILTPSTSESYHICRYNLHRGNQVEMRSLGWALIQCYSVLLKRGNLVTETDTQGEDSHVIGRMHLQAKE